MCQNNINNYFTSRFLKKTESGDCILIPVREDESMC